MTDPPSSPTKLSILSEREPIAEWRPGAQPVGPHPVAAPPSVPRSLFPAILGAIVLMTVMAFAACIYVATSRGISPPLQSQLVDTFIEVGKMGFVGLLGLVGGKATH